MADCSFQITAFRLQFSNLSLQILAGRLQFAAAVSAKNWKRKLSISVKRILACQLEVQVETAVKYLNGRIGQIKDETVNRIKEDEKEKKIMLSLITLKRNLYDNRRANGL